MKNGKLWVFTAIIVLVVFVKVLLMPFGDLDEIWVYNVSRGIVQGLIPYKDIEMVYMPLYSFIFSIPLLIVKNLFVYRITSAVLLSAIALILMVTIGKETSLWYGFPAALSVVVLFDTATYNFLFLFFALLVYNAGLKQNSNSRNLVIGILTALCTLTRQTSGVVIIIAQIIFLLFENRFNKGEKVNAPGSLKSIMFFILGFAMPCTVFLIYLLATGSFLAFWDHCFFALFGFGQNNSGVDSSATLPLMVTAVGLLCDLVLLKRSPNKNVFNHILVSISVLAIAVPIVDLHHTVMAEAICLIPVTKTIRLFFIKYMRKSFSVVLSLIFIAQNIFVTVISLQGGVFFSDRYNELELIPLTGVAEDFNYIAERNREYKLIGKNVIVFSASSALISILSDECNFPYDMFLTGLLGTTDPVEYAKEACNDPTNIILMPNDYRTENFENPDGIYEYIVSHCVPVDSYGHFVYYMPAP